MTRKYWIEYVAWGSGFIMLGLVLNVPFLLITLVTGAFFLFLAFVHWKWG